MEKISAAQSSVDLLTMLCVREERAAIAETLLSGSERVLITFNMNIPGPVKNSSWIRECYDYGLADLLKVLEQWGFELVRERDLSTGPEGYLVRVSGQKVSCDFKQLKMLLVDFEDTHPIGRWFDIDLKDQRGLAVSRTELGLEPRRCFLCEGDAKACGRSRAHSVEELFEYTREMLLSYIERIHKQENHIKRTA